MLKQIRLLKDGLFQVSIIWFERWGEADPEKDWIPDENTYGAYLDSIIGTTIELRDPSVIRKDIEVSMSL